MSRKEVIKGLEMRKKDKTQSLNGCPGFFLDLRFKILNDIDTLDRCILKYKSQII